MDFKAVCLLVFLVTSVLGDGELDILHSPKEVKFSGHQVLKSNDFSQVLLAAMGHSTSMSNSWSGLSIKNPFSYPKTTIIIVFEGVSKLQFSDRTYPLHLSLSSLEKAKTTLAAAVNNLFDETNLVTQTGVDGFKLEYLNIGEEAVTEFVNDMGLMQDLKRMVASKANIDTIWIQLKGLGKVAHQYGLESTEAKEAFEIAKNTLKQLEAIMQNADGDQFFLAAISIPRHVRHVRSAKEDDNGSGKDGFEGLNLSKRYDENYSAIFNIILWMSIFLIAALISVSVFICTLDPGRDSIIYRMTTQRIKKDN